MEINGFEIDKYNQHGFKDRAKNDVCPFCSADRKKKTDKCVSLFWDTGFFTCNHCGEKGQLHTSDSVDLFALVSLDTKQVGFMLNKDVKQTMAFRPDYLKGTYKDENSNREVTGTYLSDLTLEKVLCQI